MSNELEQRAAGYQRIAARAAKWARDDLVFGLADHPKAAGRIRNQQRAAKREAANARKLLMLSLKA